MWLKYLLVLLLPLGIYAEIIPFDMAPSGYQAAKFPKVKILDSVILSFDRIDGQKFFGISALSYNQESHLLYMLSDRSRLFAFQLKIERGKITKLDPVFGRRLRDKYGHKYFVKKSDSEGMTLLHKKGIKSLLISFEHIPRVTEFDLQGRAKKIKTKNLNDIRRDLRLTHLPKILQNPRHYRKKNNMLESVTVTKTYGMVTTPEFPLKKAKAGLHGIYNQKGKICDIHENKSYAITELETLSDGNLLALHRGFQLKPSLQIDVKLSKIYLDKIENGICRNEILFEGSTAEGWALDNFEGVAHIEKNLYLLVSDDNGNFFQKTLLVLISLD